MFDATVRKIEQLYAVKEMISDRLPAYFLDESEKSRQS